MKIRTFALAALLSSTCLLQAQYYSELIRIPDSIKAKDRICFAMYTVHENTVKLTAQLYPIHNYEPFEASLSLKQNGEWVKVADTRIDYPGFTARFRLEEWDDTREVEYRVEHNNTAFYTGIIRKNPVGDEEFVMAAFTGNAIYPQHGGDLSKRDIVDNLLKIEPDLLFFSGDQVYDHSDHLLYWLRFGRDFGDIIRVTPTISIPDDHDVGQGNLWGEGGIPGTDRNGGNGGYYMPVSYIQEVERAQASNLPDPFDPAPIEQGIGVYYTDLKWGGMSFAILEDRKFKTGPNKMRNELREKYGRELAGMDPAVYDIPGAKLLGDRQMEFLRHWTTDWEDAKMKSVLSQTIFAHSANRGQRSTGVVRRDFDSNGWPKSGRDKALKEIRKSFSCHVAGDQHLGTVIHHGIDDWNDAVYSFCVPSIANYWLRWWLPEEPGNNRKPGSPEYTGEFLDGFHNKITYHAVANPQTDQEGGNGKLTTRAAGFGLVRYNKPERTVTFECWPRNVDITDPESRQYEGWPVTITQADNYRMENGYVLPELKIAESDQVVTVIDSKTGETISSLRIKGNSYQPRVPAEGNYDILVGVAGSQTRLNAAEAKKKNKKTIKVSVGGNQ